MKIGDASAAYVLFRVALGLDMLMHGVSRFITGLPRFVDGLVHDFQSTILPSAMVRLTATVIPFVEVAIGALLLLGLATRWVLAAGVAFVCLLIFGSALQGKWDIVTQQLIYAAAFSGLLATARWNRFAVDTGLRPETARVAHERASMRSPST
jgi:thiosulfate dehydrogenase (quinone) large subunit